MNPDLSYQSEVNEIIGYTFAFFIAIAIVFVLFFYFSSKKIIKIGIEKKKLAVLHQTELANAIIITQEEERKRIAQNLHDDISSKLNMIAINNHLLQTADLPEDQKEALSESVIRLINNALDSSHRIAHDLLPAVLQNFGLHHAIIELCKEASSGKMVFIDYQNNINFLTIAFEKHLHIFRILQELINNSLKHSKTKNIKIFFTEKKDSFLLQYLDYGIGFDPINLKKSKGLGMKNIESRVNFINATMHIQTNENKGFEFVLKF
jgi:two-component system, NarL family, sensor kinase